MTRRKHPLQISRIPGNKPKRAMLELGELSCDVVDGIFYTKILDHNANEIIVPITAKHLVFNTLAELNQYLTNPLRYAGQIVTCLEAEENIFVLSNDKDQWLIAAGNQEHYDKHFSIPVTHTMEEVILHNLGKKPSVEILDNTGSKCIADIQHIDNNSTKISFNNYFTGKITFN